MLGKISLRYVCSYGIGGPLKMYLIIFNLIVDRASEENIVR